MQPYNTSTSGAPNYESLRRKLEAWLDQGVNEFHDEWVARVKPDFDSVVLPLANAGDADAQHLLGVVLTVLGIRRSDGSLLQLAVDWYRKAAEKGHAGAQHDLGMCYNKGLGVPQDFAQAVGWYRSAAEKGHAGAQHDLGMCFFEGKGVARDYLQAVEWFRKAAEQGFARAQHNLGVCYDEGLGVPQHFAQAVGWYFKAADRGNAMAQFNLGLCFEYGLGVAPDFAQAVDWYRRAAENGIADALFKLGLCYANGRGAPPDDNRAYGYLVAAANQDSSAAQFALAQAYLEGSTLVGGMPDFGQALSQFKAATRARKVVLHASVTPSGSEREVGDRRWACEAISQASTLAKWLYRNTGEPIKRKVLEQATQYFLSGDTFPYIESGVGNAQVAQRARLDLKCALLGKDEAALVGELLQTEREWARLMPKPGEDFHNQRELISQSIDFRLWVMAEVAQKAGQGELPEIEKAGISTETLVEGVHRLLDIRPTYNMLRNPRATAPGGSKAAQNWARHLPTAEQLAVKDAAFVRRALCENEVLVRLHVFESDVDKAFLRIVQTKDGPDTPHLVRDTEKHRRIVAGLAGIKTLRALSEQWERAVANGTTEDLREPIERCRQELEIVTCRLDDKDPGDLLVELIEECGDTLVDLLLGDLCEGLRDKELLLNTPPEMWALPWLACKVSAGGGHNFGGQALCEVVKGFRIIPSVSLAVSPAQAPSDKCSFIRTGEWTSGIRRGQTNRKLDIERHTRLSCDVPNLPPTATANDLARLVQESMSQCRLLHLIAHFEYSHEIEQYARLNSSALIEALFSSEKPASASTVVVAEMCNAGTTWGSYVDFIDGMALGLLCSGVEAVVAPMTEVYPEDERSREFWGHFYKNLGRDLSAAGAGRAAVAAARELRNSTQKEHGRSPVLPYRWATMTPFTRL